jgi:hypothetical protein
MKGTIRTYMEPSFLICVLVLAIAGASKSVVIQKMGIQLTKLAIPLEKPFDQMDETLLLPYKVVNKSDIKNKDIIESLGTEEYIQWIIEDTQIQESSPVKYCSLFVTYYTGDPDQVPHVPEECYVGGGHQIVSSKSVKLKINPPVPACPEIPDEINIRYSVFSGDSSNAWQLSTEYPVLYFFKVNGDYASGRTETRRVMGENFFGKYSYFSKVEWKFFGNRSGSTFYPIKEETIVAASEKLLSVFLPVMEREHWPDWKSLSSRAENINE